MLYYHVTYIIDIEIENEMSYIIECLVWVRFPLIYGYWFTYKKI